MRKTRMTRGRISYRCNKQRTQNNLCILEPSIRLGAAILDFCGIARLSFLGLNLQAAKLGWMGSLMGTGDGANIQNNMARVMHGYLVCRQVREEHLIPSAILAADLLAVHPGCVPAGCEEMCGTALEAKKKTAKRTASTWEASKGTTPALHPVEQSHTCLLFDLEHDECVVLQRGRVRLAPPVPRLGKPLLVALREKGCGQEEGDVAQEDA